MIIIDITRYLILTLEVTLYFNAVMHRLNAAGCATRGKMLVCHSSANAESRCHGSYILSTAKLLLIFRQSLKVKVKVALLGFFNTAAVRPIVFLSPTSSRIHLQRRHASYRCARPPPAKAGTITNEFC